MIDNAPVDETGLKFVDGNDETISQASIVANRGTRHQSALSFVKREEGVVVFVCNSDVSRRGGTSA